MNYKNNARPPIFVTQNLDDSAPMFYVNKIGVIVIFWEIKWNLTKIEKKADESTHSPCQEKRNFSR